MTEEQLLVRLGNGDPLAFDILYDRYWKLLYTTVYNRIAEHDIANDIVQEVLVSIWQKRTQIAIKTNLQNYLLGAVKMQVLNYFRAESSKQRVYDFLMAETEIIAGGVEEFFSMQQMEDGLVRAIHNLPINMKRSFLLRRNNMSIKEIALRLNLAEQTVTNNIAEAVKRLRKEFVNKTQENIYEL
jgi:RNA polymerase sigma factor (sigma-70 family)